MSDASVSVIVDNTELGTVQVLVQVRGYGTNTDTGISTVRSSIIKLGIVIYWIGRLVV